MKLSIVVPCYNEENTLKECIEKVLNIESNDLKLEIIIIDDFSTDKSLKIAKELENYHSAVKVYEQNINKGKGAALAKGFKKATGNFVAIQDADLEYNPLELKKLLIPLIDDKADVVLGSRFQSMEAHRVLYFWHSMGNKFLTLLSNMFTDLNLTDMETCYKVFKKEVIQSIDIEEKRFGFEPEIVAKIAQKRVRIYEMGISYYGRTYNEGKKIGVKDGLRALYCIFKYNAHKAPILIQGLIYFFIGFVSAIVNVSIFSYLFSKGIIDKYSYTVAFIVAAFLNHFLCLLILFRSKAKYSLFKEIIFSSFLLLSIMFVDLFFFKILILKEFKELLSSFYSYIIGLPLIFYFYKEIIFKEEAIKKW